MHSYLLKVMQMWQMHLTGTMTDFKTGLSVYLVTNSSPTVTKLLSDANMLMLGTGSVSAESQ